MVTGPRPPGRGDGGRLPHNPALDGLRGLAVVGVLLFHAGHLTGGYLGVDLFFVLSGYLITSLLILEWAASGSLSLTDFWVRRARRLLPALLAVILTVSVAARLFVPPVARGQLRGEGVATLGYVANWYAIASGGGYWEQTLLPSWLEHTWSLAIEEQFYVLWPLAAVLVWGRTRREARPPTGDLVRRGVRRLEVVAWSGAVVSSALMIVLALAGATPDRLYLGTDTRAAAILFGAGLACRQHLAAAGTRPPTNRWRTTAAGLAGAVVLATAWVALDGTGEGLYRGGLLACGLGATLVLLDVTTAGETPLKRLLAVRPLRSLGVISYGLYLWHWPIFQLLRPGRVAAGGWALVALRIGASIAVAMLSYRLVERPIRQGALQGRPARVTVALASSTAIVALVLGTAGAVDPAPTSMLVAADVDAGYAGPPDVRRVMVVGDSVAALVAAEGMAPLADELGIQVLNAGLVGCTILRDGTDRVAVTRNCSPDWPDQLRRHRPDIVVVLFGVWMGVAPLAVDGEDVWPCDAPWQENWSARLDRAVTVLSQTGAEVVLVSAPTAPDPIWKGADPDLFDARQACSNRALRAVAQARREAGFVDLARFVCPTARSCRSELDGADLRFDALHFAGEGATAISRWLVPEILRVAG